MEAFSFVLISFLSLQIFQVEGDNVQSVPAIYLERKKGNISETLGVTIIFGETDPLPGVCLQVQPFCRQVLVDRSSRTGVQLDHNHPGLYFIPSNGRSSIYLDLTFNCSETALFDNPVDVTAAIYSSTTPNQCETDQDHLLSEKAALIYDDRGIV